MGEEWSTILLSIKGRQGGRIAVEKFQVCWTLKISNGFLFYIHIFDQSIPSSDLRKFRRVPDILELPKSNSVCGFQLKASPDAC